MLGFGFLAPSCCVSSGAPWLTSPRWDVLVESSGHMYRS